MPVGETSAGGVRAESLSRLGTLEQVHELLQAFPVLFDSPSDLQRVTDVVRDLMAVDVAVLVDTSSGSARVTTASPPELAPAAAGLTGPALQASRSGTEVHYPDLLATPDEGGDEAAPEQLLQSVAALPLIAHERSLGALSLHLGTVRDWTEDELALARLAANLIAVHLDHAAALHDQRVLSGQLRAALDSRVVIEQAKGVLAASDGIGVDEAFARMRSQARRTNTRLLEVATEVVARTLRRIG